MEGGPVMTVEFEIKGPSSSRSTATLQVHYETRAARNCSWMSRRRHKRVMKAMLKMRKLNIAALQHAA